MSALGACFTLPLLFLTLPRALLCCRQGRGAGLFSAMSFCNVPLQGFASAPLPGNTRQAYGLQWLVLFLFILFQVLGQK